MSHHKLSPAKFQKAREFIYAHARPVDVQLFAYYFEGRSDEDVLEALAAYQNEDGGFGHGIEPDFRLKASSPMATSVGLQYTTAVSTPTSHPIIQNAIRYLLNTYNVERGYWPATYENVNDEPHAFWWHVNEMKPPDETAWPNPSAELVGYLHQHAVLVPADFLAQVTARARQNLDFSDIITGNSPQKYNVLCWQRALPYLPDDMKTAVSTAITRTFQSYDTIQPDTFEELSTLHFTPSPDAILARLFPDVIDECLDTEISQQSEDGGWWPSWHWGQFEDVWPVAKQEWAGKITIENLHIFKQFGRLS
jgi:hypothetical protein